MKRLDAPVEVEPPREGEDPSTCVACAASDDAYIWVSDRWRVRATETPTGLPMVLILESRSHLDLGDLPNLLAAELGVMTVRLERAIRSLDEVAQVHVNRWGDGTAHLHLWFLGRPLGRLQLRGPFLAMWDEILEPVPEEPWRNNLAHIAAWLEEFGGRAVAEPPRIEWHAPSTFAGIAAIEDPAVDASLGEVPPKDTAVPNNVATNAAAPDAAASNAVAPEGTADDASSAAASADAGGEDWTAVEYDEAGNPTSSAEGKTPANGNQPKTATETPEDESPTVAVRIPAQSPRSREARSSRLRAAAPDPSMDFIKEMAGGDSDLDLASDSR